MDDGLTVNAQEGNNKADSGANQNYRSYNVHTGVDEMSEDLYNPYAYGYYPLRMRSTSYANNGADGSLYYGRQLLGYGGLGYGYPFAHLGKRSADGDPNAQAEPDTTNQILNLMPELKLLQTQELTPEQLMNLNVILIPELVLSPFPSDDTFIPIFIEPVDVPAAPESGGEYAADTQP